MKEIGRVPDLMELTFYKDWDGEVRGSYKNLKKINKKIFIVKSFMKKVK